MIGLVRCAGTGTGEDPFRPAVDDAELQGAIDLRPDCTVPDGLWLVRADTVDEPFGDDPDARLTAARRTAVESRLGVTLADRQLKRVVADLLIDHGDDANPRRWNRLRAARGRLEVWLGGAQPLWSLALPAGGASAVDSFDRANNADPTAGAPVSYTIVNGSTGWSINTNFLRCSPDTATDATTEWLMRCDTVFASDHVARADIAATVSGARRFGLAIRVGTGNDRYVVMYDPQRTSGQRKVIGKIVSGTYTLLNGAATSADIAALTWATVIATCSGSSISELWSDDGWAKTVTDTSITVGTKTGFSALATASNNRVVRFDNFAAGDIPTTVTLTPASTTLTAPAISPQPQPVTVALTPATLTAAAVAVDPQPQPVTVALAPAQLTLTATALDPQPQLVTVDLTPATVAFTAATITAVPQPVTIDLTPADLTLTATAVDPVPQPGTVTLEPAAVTFTAAPVDPQPQTVTVDLTPATVTVTASPLAPLGLPGMATLTPTTIDLDAVAVTPVPQPVSVALAPSDVAFTAVAVTPVPQLLTVVLAPAAITLTAPVVIILTPTPPERLGVVGAESRSYLVPAESRTGTVPAESRFAKA